MEAAVADIIFLTLEEVLALQSAFYDLHYSRPVYIFVS